MHHADYRRGFELARVNNSRFKIRVFGVQWGEVRRHRGDTLWTATGRVDGRTVTVWGRTHETAYHDLLTLVRDTLNTHRHDHHNLYAW